jgi:hypothetical protein
VSATSGPPERVRLLTLESALECVNLDFAQLSTRKAQPIVAPQIIMPIRNAISGDELSDHCDLFGVVV